MSNIIIPHSSNFWLVISKMYYHSLMNAEIGKETTIMYKIGLYYTSCQCKLRCPMHSNLVKATVVQVYVRQQLS